MTTIDIGGRLHSVTQDRVVAVANEILDDNLHWKQNDINRRLWNLNGVFDISAYNKSNGVLATYTSLTQALAAVPDGYHKGGMSINFIHLTPATYSVVKTEGLTEQPAGTELQSASVVVSGTYNADQLSDFATLPATIGTAVTYYVAVTVDEVTTYTSWVIIKLTADVTKYVQYRLMSTDWSEDENDWQEIGDEDKVYNPLVFSGLGRVYLRKNIEEGVWGETINSDDCVLEEGRYGKSITTPIDFGSEGVRADITINGATNPEGYSLNLTKYKRGEGGGTSSPVANFGWSSHFGENIAETYKNFFEDSYIPFINEDDYDFITVVLSKLDGEILDTDTVNFSITSKTASKNLLTQSMINKPNTIYHIQYDFDLNGATITIPEGCALEFEGGSISNGTINGDDFKIISTSKCFDNITFTGKCIVNLIPKLEWWVSKYPEDANDVSVDNTEEIQQCIDCGCLSVMFPWDKFLHVSKTIIMEYPVNIMVNKHNDLSELRYSGNSFARHMLPCLFSKEVVTIFDITLKRREGFSKYPFGIGQLNIYIDVEYSQLTDESINTPVIDIKSGGENSRGQTTTNIVLDCNIKAHRYSISLPPEERTDDTIITKQAFNYTGIRIDSSEGPISHIRINGDLYYLFCGARIMQGEGGYTDSERANWLTDIILNGSTFCCYGVRTNTGQLIVHNSHEPAHIPPAYRDYEGYFVGKQILFYGYVWDLEMSDENSTWSRAVSAFTSTRKTDTQVYYGLKDTSEKKIKYRFENPITYAGHCSGSTDLQPLPNLLYNGLYNMHPITALSYKTQFVDEEELVESLYTDRIFNTQYLFNDNLRATNYNTSTYKVSANLGHAYTKSPWQKMECSFVLRSTNIHWNSSWAPLHLLVGVAERRAGENPIVHIRVCTGSSLSNIDTEHPIYDEDIREAGLRTFTSHIKLDLQRIGIDNYSRITVTVTRPSTDMVVLPYISIPNYFGEKHPYLAVDNDKLPHLTEYSKGMQLFNNTLKKEIVWDGSKYIYPNGDPIEYALKITPKVLKGYSINNTAEIGEQASLVYSSSGISVHGWPGIYDSVLMRVNAGSLIRIKGVAHVSYRLWALIDETDHKVIAISKGSSGQVNMHPIEDEILVDRDCLLACNFCNEHYRYTQEDVVIERPYGNTEAIPYSIDILTNKHPVSYRTRGSFENVPNLLNSDIGFIYFNTSKNKPIWYDGEDWREADGEKSNIRRIGTKTQRPIGSNITVGFKYLQVDQTYGTCLIWASAIDGDNVTWLDEQGYTPGLHKGTTTQRNALELNDSIDIGYQYYDTTLKQPIYYGGDGKWYDVTGNEVTA